MATLCALNLGQAGLAARVLRPNLGQELVGQLQGGVEAGALAMPQRVGCNCQVPPSKEPDLFWPRLARLTPLGARTPIPCFEN